MFIVTINATFTLIHSLLDHESDLNSSVKKMSSISSFLDMIFPFYINTKKKPLTLYLRKSIVIFGRYFQKD